MAIDIFLIISFSILYIKTKKPINLLFRFTDLSFVDSSERGIRTLDTTGMNRVL